MKVAEWTTDFGKRQHLWEVLDSLLMGEDYGPGKIVIRVLEDDEEDSETGRVIVSFCDRVIIAGFDYEGIVKELMKPMKSPTLRIEIHEKESVSETIGE